MICEKQTASKKKTKNVSLTELRWFLHSKIIHKDMAVHFLAFTIELWFSHCYDLVSVDLETVIEYCFLSNLDLPSKETIAHKVAWYIYHVE